MSNPQEPPATHRPALGGLLLAAAFVVGILALAWFQLRVFEPREWVAYPKPERNYATTPLEAAMDLDAIAARHETLLGFGSRFMGQPGFYATRDYIRDQFAAAGLEVIEHNLRSVVPVTQRREIQRLGPDGIPSELPGVEVFPFRPNHLQPVATPPEGITGELLLMTPEVLRTRADFRDVIALVDARDGAYDPAFGFAWGRYADLGVKAVIIAHRDGLAHAPWIDICARKHGMVSSVPVNFPRLAATPEIFQYQGERIRLRVNVTFEEVEHTTLIGTLRAQEPTQEAMILPIAYDAMAHLPDRAPGVIPALRLATHLQLLEGLKHYRASIRRDLIFVAFGGSFHSHAGLDELLRVIRNNRSVGQDNPLLEAFGLNEKTGEEAGTSKRQLKLDQRIARHRARATHVEAILPLLQDRSFLFDPEATREALDTIPSASRTFFLQQFAYVLDSIVLERQEPVLQARIEDERSGSLADYTSPAYRAYQNAKTAFDQAQAAAGFRPVGLLRDKPEFARDVQIGTRVRARFKQLGAYHARLDAQYAEEQAIIDLFERYAGFSIFYNYTIPATSEGTQAEEMTLFFADDTKLDPAALSFGNVFEATRRSLGLEDSVSFEPLSSSTASLTRTNIDPFFIRDVPFWRECGWGAYAVVSLQRRDAFFHHASPGELPFMRNLESLRGTLAVMGDALLSIAHGNGKSGPGRIAEWRQRDWGGKVLVSNVGQSIVPNYPLAGATVAGRGKLREAEFSMFGFSYTSLRMTNPYGEYSAEFNSNDFPAWWGVNGEGYSPVAAGYDEWGRIKFMKDEGEDGQRLFKSVKVDHNSRAAVGNVTIVLFRATPVTLLNLTNPQTLKDYTALDALSQEGLTAFRKRCHFSGVGMETLFLEPGQRFFALLKAGAPENELVQATRAFLLNIEDPAALDPERTIDGHGYLAQDTPFLLRPAFEAAESMLLVNGRRLALQNRYGMADDRTNEFHQRAEAILAEAAQPGLPHREASRRAEDAVVYATLNHPILRESIYEAVIGILWYLGLLIPFVFFFEKLVFGFSDVRKQLAAQGIIFLVVYALLNVLHPAFEMVRSSMMILLGFVIILISGGITLLFSGKFQENFEELRKKRGKVSAAEVNAMGVAGSAFMLGLNNMNRRKVRTGLTCATLTLLTFVMISFTSVRNDVVEDTVALGKAPYQGMLVKRELFRPISEAEVFAIRKRYADRFDVCTRAMYLGQINWQTSSQNNPELVIEHRTQADNRRVPFSSVLFFEPQEPLRHQIELITDTPWFSPLEQEGGGDFPIFIPEEMANRLGISPRDVERAPVHVQVNSRPFVVRGIFRSKSVADLRDLDGLDLLPFDLPSMPDAQRDAANTAFVLAEKDAPRIRPEDLIIAPKRDMRIRVPGAGDGPRTVSLSISMPTATYREASEAIEGFMVQTAEPLHYGLDGVAYRGERTRKASLSGLVDLIIPLVIAALTVLNTMKGSVYERRSEIYVYNAVGIAPRYIFMMFFAEAFVYAVVGSILGYLLSQGTGRILTELELTGGLNMTYTSLTTIYASLTIVAAVIVSTYFPARSALDIAAPAEDAGWELPEPDGDSLAFDLPFNFLPRERLAVLEFFARYLRDHGEGGAGRFFSGDPKLDLIPIHPADPDSDYLPQVQATIWLKPFDLAVSQELIVSTPHDPETGQFKAHLELTRLSGTSESWQRLNAGFVRQIRRHFLHWRATAPEERLELFEVARQQMRACLQAATAKPAQRDTPGAPA